MSSDIVIRVENLSKRYVLKHASGRASGDGLRHAIQDAVTSPFRRLNAKFRKQRSDTSDSGFRSPLSAFQEDFYALRDVSFEVKRGEVLGIIGRNGAGKSTLLKILSRITEPSSGRIGIKGRVASLLEVGTGFHPELTGRENIFLNGAILGMTRAEVKWRFDEIIEFAGVEKFLDTPVKRYSSGMYVRLAFAVAAHLDPEILIIDEVLAVGDAAFQGKCINKLQQLSSVSGRTVIFVSHNCDAINRLCSSAIHLASGTLAAQGNASTIVARYLKEEIDKPFSSGLSGPKTGITDVQVKIAQSPLNSLSISIAFSADDVMTAPVFGIVVESDQGNPIFGSNTLFHPWEDKPRELNKGCVTVKVPSLPLWNGVYFVSVWLSDGPKILATATHAAVFRLVNCEQPLRVPEPQAIGYLHLPCEWSTETNDGRF